MGLKGLNVSSFMEAAHRRLLLALFTALHPFDQESFALHPSPCMHLPVFLPPSLSLALFPPPTSQSFCDGI